MEYYSAIENNEIVLLAGTWTDLECHAGGSQSEGEVSHDIPYMQNLKKNGTNELIYKTETDLENGLMVAGGRRGEMRGRGS